MLQTCITIGLCAALVSVTITRSRIFEPLRDWLNQRTTWTYSLVSCAYCVCHWVAAAGFLIYRPRLVHGPIALLDYLVTGAAIGSVAAIAVGLMLRLYTFRSEV